MTYITKIVLHGFKSFAKRTEVVFENSYNCILGPNGSGKSNVLDAICFVLGKSSVKGLRAEKTANLVYNGGRSKKPAKFGEVSIFFDNKNKVFPLECDEVKVSRIVKQNGQSTYRINDETRTRQQVIELLSIAKINPDGYNIILQGDIVNMVEMSASERRKIIEEIAGISIYEEKKQKALSELEKVDGKLTEADIILVERKTHLTELKSERDQALKFKDLKDKVDSNKASYLQIQIDKKELDNSNYEKLRNEYEDKIQKLNESVKKLRSKNDEIDGHIDAINKEVEAQGERSQVQLHKEVENLKVQVATNQNRIESCQNEITKIKQRKEQLKEDLEDIENKINDVERNNVDLVERRDAKKKTEAQVIEKINTFKNKHKIDNVTDIEQDIEKLDAQIEEGQNKITQLHEVQQNLFREKDKIEYQIRTLQEKIAKVEEVEKENKKQLEELKKKKNEFKKTTIELNSLLNEDSSLAAQIGTHRKRVIDLGESLERLRAKESRAREMIAGGEATKFILAQKGKTQGIFGLVSELGSVKTKYSMALEIAAGSKIHNIVVDTDQTAGQCISQLKQRRLGTASFIPLNKIRAPLINPELKKLRTVNGVIDFAINLISFDSAYKKAFEYVFGTTLIVDSLEVARRIGIGRVRMVTLDGDVAEGSGVMKGGHREKRRRQSFKENEVGEDISRIEKELFVAQSNLQVLEKKRVDNEEKIQKLREFKALLEGEIIKQEKILHLESGDLSLSKTQKKDLEDSLKKIDDNLQEMNIHVSQENSKLARVKIQRQTLKNKISDLRNPRHLAELNAFEDKRNLLRQEIIAIEGKIANNKSRLSTIFVKERDNLHKILKQVQREEENFSAEIKELEASIKADKRDINEKEKKEKKFYAEFKSLFEKRNTFAEARRMNDEQIMLKNEKLKEFEIKLNNLSLQGATVRAQIASLHEELKQYEGVEINTTKSEAVIRREINEFERLIADIGNVNMKALEIYETVEEEYNKLCEKKAMLESEKVEILKLMDEIELKKKEIFTKSFEEVRTAFKQLFSKLSTKGDADLVLENPASPFDGGVTINVRLSGNKYLDIRSLSGGEKTMTALAFIFAIQEYEPASFYVLDEVDAALDKKNAELLSNLVRKYSDRAQYIIISHNDTVISNANLLYGVSMDEHGISKVVSLKI